MSTFQAYANRTARELDNAELHRIAPSIFASEAHESRSERYTFIPTINIVEGMRAAGFYPVAAAQGRSRIEGKSNYTKHAIRFRSRDSKLEAVGDEVIELNLLNSADGTSSYQLDAAVRKLACMNGLIVDSQDIASIKVPHRGDIIGQVIEGSYTIINDAPKVFDAISDMRAERLEPEERVIFANAAKLLRWDSAQQQIDAGALLRPRRIVDQGNDLWTTFNVVQEHILRGGDVVRNTETRSRRRAGEIKSVSDNQRLNKALWQLAEQMRTLKAA